MFRALYHEHVLHRNHHNKGDLPGCGKANDPKGDSITAERVANLFTLSHFTDGAGLKWAPQGVHPHVLQAHQYEFYRKWYYAAIMVLIEIYPFRGDYSRLAKMLRRR